MNNNATAKSSSKAPAISRAAAVLRLLGRSDTPLGVNAIARELGIVPSTCLYLLRALADEELVAFDPASKLYSLDAGVLSLARGWLRRDRFADLAQPMLDRIAREHGVTALGVQIFGLDHIIVTAKAEGGGAFQLSAQVGSRFPALISATGRCIAAFGGYREADIAARFAKLRWENAPSWGDWMAQVAEAKQKGYAFDAGNYISGVTVMAAPVRHGAERFRHAFVALKLGGIMPDDERRRLGEMLMLAGHSLASQMQSA